MAWRPADNEVAQNHSGSDVRRGVLTQESDTIEQLISNMNNCIIAVGTTSLRTIESLYWMGVKTILTPITIGAGGYDQFIEKYEFQKFKDNIGNSAR